MEVKLCQYRGAILTGQSSVRVLLCPFLYGLQNPDSQTRPGLAGKLELTQYWKLKLKGQDRAVLVRQQGSVRFAEFSQTVPGLAGELELASSTSPAGRQPGQQPARAAGTHVGKYMGGRGSWERPQVEVEPQKEKPGKGLTLLSSEDTGPGVVRPLVRSNASIFGFLGVGVLGGIWPLRDASVVAPTRIHPSRTASLQSWENTGSVEFRAHF